MLKCKKNIPIFIVMFLGSILAALYVVAYMDATLRREVLPSYQFKDIVITVIENKRALQIYGYVVAMILLGFLYLLLIDTKSYKSAQMKITDTIDTPVPAGQGQCGTAKWLPKKEYDKVFSNYEFDKEALCEWDKIKLDDIKEELGRIK